MTQKQNLIYDREAVEQKWRDNWWKMDLYATGSDSQKPDMMILDFFPYPSGDGLSVGHGRNYVPTCVSSRFHRMRGYNVLHPMGWDAFGLPAENYAIKHGIHPSESSAKFCATYKRQMQLLACSYDWSREFSSTDPDYYRWTQWFFLLLYERGLAYRAVGRQWWCPECHTVLANEQVENGRCWRCHSEVTKKELAQWFFKITEYAERLLADLDGLDWPESIKAMQRNWIGRSEGVEIHFPVENQQISVFTTRPDTLYGVTYLALAPEHPLVMEITTSSQAHAVKDYSDRAQRQSEIERMAVDEAKSGVFSGAYARHPLSGEPIPIWIADYVLPGYGSGAVMGVPAHDTRDYAFAQQHGLPVVTVIKPQEQIEAACYTGEGILQNSGRFNGITSQAGRAAITAELAARAAGQKQVTYRMRDWLISRQRYWGAPIPIVYCDQCGAVPLPPEALPLRLPDTDDFAPAGDGRSPLARVDAWVHTACPQCDGPARRETDTLDGFACSSWYFLRFVSPDYANGPFDPDAMRRWMPVDTYVGGAEHAVMHLLYARFWTKVMFDAGLVPFNEPFTQLRNQGVLHAPDGLRMSKSKGNVITPDEVITRHGTDAARAYTLFIGPFDGDVTWQENGIKGVTRFLERYWRLATEPLPIINTQEDAEFERARHKTVQRLTLDMADFRFNTAVAALMEYLNGMETAWKNGVHPEQWRRAIETFTLLLCPIAPFITEEIWRHVLGNSDSVHQQTWPEFDPAMTVDEQVTIVVQVNGKLRDRINMAVNAEEGVVRETAVASPKVQRSINGKPIRRLVVVPNKLVNIVV